MSQTANLFACSKCYTRHPFEELSANQQLCKVILKKYKKRKPKNKCQVVPEKALKPIKIGLKVILGSQWTVYNSFIK